MSKPSLLERLGASLGDEPIRLQSSEYILRIKRVHWWVFAYPVILLLIALYLLSKTRGYFTLEFLLYLPETRPAFIPAEIYKYMLMAMELIREYVPKPIHDFMVYTKLSPLKWICQLFLLYALYKLIRAFLTFLFTKVTLTDRRIIVKIGIIQGNYLDIPLEHLAVFHQQSSLFSRFLGVSTLILQSAGGLVTSIPAIHNAPELRTDILTLQQKRPV